ncbi:MAG: bifunctional riboflavin kinase/FAD synthetase [Akkermansiaceae bacterium]
MVKLIENISGLSSVKEPLHLALGVFDGLHIGHQQVISTAVRAAHEQGGASGVLTFEPHPIRVLAPDLAPSRILASLNHKRELLSKLDVDLMVVVDFNKKFANCEAEDFLGSLITTCHDLKTICIGEDWKFGKNRRGDIELLRDLGHDEGITINSSQAVMIDGERVSSTRIRQAIRDGNMAAAEAMLGRKYTVFGEVIEGRQLGRKLGFPTANLKVFNEQLPSNGVWCISAILSDGSRLNGVGNLGVRPTVEGAEAKRMLEIHLLDFDQDIYGMTMEVEFLKYMRTEKKFSSVDELSTQIQHDVLSCSDFHRSLNK